MGAMTLNSVFVSTDASNYLYNNGPPTLGISHHRLSENKNANIIKDHLIKVKINDLGNPFLRYRIANQKLLMGTSINWNLNVNHTTFSSCDKYFLYRQDGTTIPTWLEFNTYAITGLTNLQFYVTNPKEIGNFIIEVCCMDA